jgi:MOSC domain-containing protein YiiM
MTRGTVASINVSGGGVPKLPRTSAYIDANGVEGDRQRNLVFHGGPDRAVCVYSLDLVEALQAEGHPIVPGAIGENLTLRGIDWSQMVPGARLQIGDLELELTSYTSPCKHIRHWFTDDAFVRVSQKVHPGWSRLYARVLAPGTVTPGDAVTLITRS